ncbi:MULTISPECIES: porin family protein [unclassified Bacteroides]|uniref:porin family protein n=1 Tax=unclassified Bacteroides TaxID=2646097 RepID=UPI0004E21C9F|nr:MULTISPECIES: porin family protein [unclassified Bacteroides]
MKKFILVMALVAASVCANAQEKARLTVKVGGGYAGLIGAESDNVKFDTSFKAGIGCEFPLNDLIGIEPSFMYCQKGFSGETPKSPNYGDYKWNVKYIEVPVMCNFHLNDKFVLGTGLYFASLIDDYGLSDTNSFDSGLAVNLKYNFKNGLSVGADMTTGFSRVFKNIEAYNCMVGIVAGYSFSF